MKIKADFLNGVGCLTLGLLVTIGGRTAAQFRLSASNIGDERSKMDPESSSFIFASFAGLLQQWPNTYAYSGHTIIPGVIPRSTLLYHGTSNSTPPTEGMEWLAFNPEMSYLIHSVRSGQLNIHTYVTSRPLRVIYIDGQSASVSTPGFMDSQSVLINGTVDEEFGDGSLVAEYTRARELCAIGKTYGFEGVVRMNTGFELIWCDFKQGIELVQVTNATDPFDQPEPNNGHPIIYPEERHPTSPFFSRAKWIFVESASRQFFAPGEVRVRLDPSGFISFYDRLESLAIKRRADGTLLGPRSRHRLYGISAQDAATIHARLVDVLARKNAQGWNFDPDQLDLQAIVLTIIQNYSQPLKHLQYTLKQDSLTAVNQSVEVRAVSYQMLMPYIDFSNNITDPFWAGQTIKKCSTAFTSEIYRLYSPDLFTESIQVIIHAIEGTLDRLCATLYDVFSQTMQMALPTNPSDHVDPQLEIEAQSKVSQWRLQTDELIRWLGWASWGECDPSCKPDEQCIIPMWPSVRSTLNANLTDAQPVCGNISTWKSIFKSV